jgi:hypothetical protein
MSDETRSGGPVLATIPRFQQPRVRRLDPNVPEDENTPLSPSDSPTPSDLPAGVYPLGLAGPTRTGTSATPGTDEKPSAKDTAKLVAGLLAMAAVGAAALVRWRLRAKLREPSKAQADEMAEPLARIGLRHVPAGKLHPDLLDATQFAAALGRYLNDGPLLERAYVDAGEIPQQGDE